jgi:putative transposase
VKGPRTAGAVAGRGAAPDRHARPGEDGYGQGGRDAARARRSASGTSPEITGLLEQVQADHTPVDVIVVDEQHRLPAGRPAAAALQVHLDSLERVSATGRLRLQLGGA